MDRRRFIAGTAVAGLAYATSRSVTQGQAMTLQNIITATPDGAPGAPNVIDLGGQVFNTEETIRVTGRNWLTLQNFTINADTDGTTATPWMTNRWPRTRSHLRIDGGSTNITVENVTVSGANPNAGRSDAAYVAALEAQHAFDIDGADTVTLRNCQGADVYGDFVYIRSSNVVVEDCVFARNGRQGIAIAAGSNIRISRCVLDEMRRSTFDLEPNTATDLIDNVIIEDCSTGIGRLLWLTAGGQGSGVRNVTIRRNTMRGLSGTPAISLAAPTGSRRGPFAVTDNVLLPQGSPRAAVETARIDGLTFTGNKITTPTSRYMTGVKATDSTGLSFSRNTFIGTATDIAVN